VPFFTNGRPIKSGLSGNILPQQPWTPPQREGSGGLILMWGKRGEDSVAPTSSRFHLRLKLELPGNFFT
jgi:hypothetical protein